ncbi:MAG: YbbR-like domain-containing protein [Acutalibacteraceae bacterium]
MAKVAVMKETKDKDKKLRVGGKTLDKQRVLTFSVMLGAFLLAILMWFYVLGYDSPNFEKRFAGIDVSVSGAAELKEKNGFAVLSEFSFTVDVTVAGKKTDVNRLSSDDIRAYIDISSLTENGRVPVRIQVDLPNGIRLASLSTDTVYIYVDRSVTAEIELDVELTDYVLTNDLLLGQPLRAQNRHRPGRRVRSTPFRAPTRRRARHGSVVGHGVAQVELYYENGEGR